MANHLRNLPSNSGSCGIAPGFGMSIAVARSEVDMEIHPRVEARDLVGVAVEHQRLPTTRFTDPLLGGLAPPRVIVGRIDVAVEPVLTRCVLVPADRRLILDQRDL